MIRNIFRSTVCIFALVTTAVAYAAVPLPHDENLVTGINDCIVNQYQHVTIESIHYDPPIASVTYYFGPADSVTQDFIQEKSGRWRCALHINPGTVLPTPTQHAQLLQQQLLSIGQSVSPAHLNDFVTGHHGHTFYVHQTFSPHAMMQLAPTSHATP